MNKPNIDLETRSELPLTGTLPEFISHQGYASLAPIKAIKHYQMRGAVRIGANPDTDMDSPLYFCIGVVMEEARETIFAIKLKEQWSEFGITFITGFDCSLDYGISKSSPGRFVEYDGFVLSEIDDPFGNKKGI